MDKRKRERSRSRERDERKGDTRIKRHDPCRYCKSSDGHHYLNCRQLVEHILKNKQSPEKLQKFFEYRFNCEPPIDDVYTSVGIVCSHIAKIEQLTNKNESMQQKIGEQAKEIEHLHETKAAPPPSVYMSLDGGMGRWYVPYPQSLP